MIACNALPLTGPLVWQQLTVGGTTPGARYAHAAFYDPVRDRMVIFGGGNTQTWAMSLSGSLAWTQLSTTGTPPGDFYDGTGIYDSHRDRFVYFGGWLANYQNSRTFALSLSGTPTWSELTPAGPLPGGKSGAAGIYDPLRDRMVIHGGQYDGGMTVHYTDATAFALEWGDIVSVPTATGAGATLQLVRPNPGGGTQAFEIELATELTEGDIDIFTVTGQRVWSRTLRSLGPGRHVIEWNGRRGHGTRVAPGVYLARLRAGAIYSTRRFVRID